MLIVFLCRNKTIYDKTIKALNCTIHNMNWWVIETFQVRRRRSFIQLFVGVFLLSLLNIINIYALSLNYFIRVLFGLCATKIDLKQWPLRRPSIGTINLQIFYPCTTDDWRAFYIPTCRLQLVTIRETGDGFRWVENNSQNYFDFWGWSYHIIYVNTYAVYDKLCSFHKNVVARYTTPQALAKGDDTKTVFDWELCGTTDSKQAN